MQAAIRMSGQLLWSCNAKVTHTRQKCEPLHYHSAQSLAEGFPGGTWPCSNLEADPEGTHRERPPGTALLRAGSLLKGDPSGAPPTLLWPPWQQVQRLSPSPLLTGPLGSSETVDMFFLLRHHLVWVSIS